MYRFLIRCSLLLAPLPYPSSFCLNQYYQLLVIDESCIASRSVGNQSDVNSERSVDSGEEENEGTNEGDALPLHVIYNV